MSITAYKEFKPKFMAFNETLSNRIREELADVPRFEEKLMFGGVCFMVNEKMCIGVVEDEMMCRIGPDAYEEALEKNGVREMDKPVFDI